MMNMISEQWKARCHVHAKSEFFLIVLSCPAGFQTLFSMLTALLTRAYFSPPLSFKEEVSRNLQGILREFPHLLALAVCICNATLAEFSE